MKESEDIRGLQLTLGVYILILGITAAFALWNALMIGWYGRIMKH